jgi:hypothetical protein
MTSMDPPVHLQLPAEPPAPVPGCGVCAALVKQWAEATAAGDHSRMTDCDAEIRNHQRGREGQA